MFRSARRPTFRSSLAKLAALVLLVCAPSRASAQTAVVFGDVITEPGVYFLAGNQSGSGSDGIGIDSDDVLLLLGRFTLRGGGDHYGIRSIGNDNVTVVGGRVTNFNYGVFFAVAKDCTARDMRLDGNRIGLVAAAMENSAFLRLNCFHNSLWGVDARECPGSRFVSILAHHNERYGILLSANSGFAGPASSTGCKVRQCWAAYNEDDGIRVEDPRLAHEIVSNECVNNAGAGIHLALFDPAVASAVQPGGPHDNLVKSNWCVFNERGIAVDHGPYDNTLTNNTALANFQRDMFDDNPEPPCANTWVLNFFLTKDGAGEDCIF